MRHEQGDAGNPPAQWGCAQAAIAEGRFRSLFLASPIAKLVIRLADGHIVDANPAFAQLLGAPLESLPQGPWTALLAPEQQAEGQQLAGALGATHRFGPVDFDLAPPDGKAVPVRISAALLPGDDAAPYCVLAIQDRQHLSADTAQLRLMAKVFEHSGEGIVITDRNNRIVAINPAFTTIMGYSADEVVGQDPNIFASGHTRPETYQDMWSTLADKGFWQGEIWDRTKDGSICPKWVTISVATDDDGEVGHYIASFTDLTDRKQATDQILHLAHHDPLTQLLNRFALEARLQQTLASARRDETQVAVLLIDLDRFKMINDTLGHHAGDQLLIEVARRLRESVRASDIVARLGGDEFVVVLPALTSALVVAAVASKIQRALADPIDVEGQHLYSTPSIGISVFPVDGTDSGTLVKNADTAMYHAKNLGRNNHQFYTASMNEAAGERLNLENALRQAVTTTHQNSSQFSLHFQPQIHAASGRIVGIEALARWRHPALGPVPPGRFIPIAEETGLILPLGDWVFWEACRQLKHFRDQGVRGVRMAINLAAQQLRQESLPSLVRGALSCYDLAPEDIELEITESTAMQNPEATIQILEKLAAMGIVLAIDDFGTGYSSLAYLKHLPIHRLKLDRSFVQDINSNPDDAAICSATVVLGHNLGLEIVAEGVETEAQRDLLHNLGCDVLQGFLYSRPLPAEEVVAFIRRHANP